DLHLASEDAVATILLSSAQPQVDPSSNAIPAGANAVAAKNHRQWLADPSLQRNEWVDSRIYSDPQIFEEELEKIFKKTWIPVCHESELPSAYDFRTMSIAREPIIVCRGPDNEIRAFLNVCPHRGMIIERRPSGSFLEGQPSGNPKRM